MPLIDVDSHPLRSFSLNHEDLNTFDSNEDCSYQGPSPALPHHTTSKGRRRDRKSENCLIATSVYRRSNCSLLSNPHISGAHLGPHLGRPDNPLSHTNKVSLQSRATISIHLPLSHNPPTPPSHLKKWHKAPSNPANPPPPPHAAQPTPKRVKEQSRPRRKRS